MGKRMNNVTDLVKKISDTKKFKDNFESEVQGKSVAKFLFSIRCDNDLTQKQLGDKIGCTQSRISKIESSYDEDISIKDLVDYARALKLQLDLGFRTPSAKIVDLIKYHALKIKYYLEQLTELAKANEDEDINKGIEKFHGETFYNMVNIILDSYSELGLSKKKLTKKKDENIHISPPIDLKDIENKKSTETV